MKKIVTLFALSVFIFSCNTGESSATGMDSVATENPTAIEDTGTQHPTGITTGSVISTDTSQFDVNPVPKDSTPKR